MRDPDADGDAEPQRAPLCAAEVCLSQLLMMLNRMFGRCLQRNGLCAYPGWSPEEEVPPTVLRGTSVPSRYLLQEVWTEFRLKSPTGGSRRIVHIEARSLAQRPRVTCCGVDSQSQILAPSAAAAPARRSTDVVVLVVLVVRVSPFEPACCKRPAGPFVLYPIPSYPILSHPILSPCKLFDLLGRSPDSPFSAALLCGYRVTQLVGKRLEAAIVAAAYRSKFPTRHSRTPRQYY
jgi:hypothetical protein